MACCVKEAPLMCHPTPPLRFGSKGSRDDVDDVFRAAIEHTEGDTNGAPSGRKEAMNKDYLSSLLKEAFELDIETAHLDEILATTSKSSDVTREDMAGFLASEKK
tara:strand:+ start:637 stop:951 length:315 start_codon:yes stop_codon:yes gene_type:complete